MGHRLGIRVECQQYKIVGHGHQECPLEEWQHEASEAVDKSTPDEWVDSNPEADAVIPSPDTDATERSFQEDLPQTDDSFDITDAAVLLSTRVSNPDVDDLAKLFRVIKHLNETEEMGICINPRNMGLLVFEHMLARLLQCTRSFVLTRVS